MTTDTEPAVVSPIAVVVPGDRAEVWVDLIDLISRKHLPVAVVSGEHENAFRYEGVILEVDRQCVRVQPVDPEPPYLPCAPTVYIATELITRVEVF